MTNQPRHIRRAAVLGAGVMGAQIAAHLANAGVPVRLYELAAEGDDKNANVRKALEQLAKLKPSPVAVQSNLNAIEPANYEQHLERLEDCDLVIEAVTERLDLKHALYERVAPHLGASVIFATNTSGIGIAKLAEGLPQALTKRFCGVHFFNPPRYMHLLEMIAHSETDPAAIEALEGFVTTTLGKGVIHAKDTPGFIGNRVGIFSMLAVLHHAQRLGLAFDLVDKLTGPGIGRPKSATFRTADVVGLDTFAHVVDSLADAVPGDPWHAHYQVPQWIRSLIEQGALGQKSGAGVYKKAGKEIHVLEPEEGDYRRVQSQLDDTVREILNERDPAKKLKALREHDHPQAEFLLAIHRDLFHFCAVHLGEIAHTARDVDLAIRWGYGWQLGPFEIWQAAGWQEVARMLTDDIAAGRTMSDTPLPEWASDAQREGVHDPSGSWSPAEGRMLPRSEHPVYRRQVFPERVLGEPEPSYDVVFETDAVRLWHTGDDLAVLSFKTKMHVIDAEVIDGLFKAVETAEKDFQALVLWQPAPPFCAGANLRQMAGAVRDGKPEVIEDMIDNFQRGNLALKYSMVPTVAAVQGMALGGGCEVLMHCDRTVAALESYIGLVEAGVGLIPGGGGCKELALRAAAEAKGGDLFPFVRAYFERVALAKVATSAEEAREWGYLRAGDAAVFNAHELLYVAKQQARALSESGYRPPLPPRDVPVAGARAIATLKSQLVNMRDGGFISEHDYDIASRLAGIVCGGEVEPGTRVSEQWLLRLEREAFMALLATEKTQARVQYMLETGKPLRN